MNNKKNNSDFFIRTINIISNFVRKISYFNLIIIEKWTNIVTNNITIVNS